MLQFTTKNYNLTTSPKQEYMWVVHQAWLEYSAVRSSPRRSPPTGRVNHTSPRGPPMSADPPGPGLQKPGKNPRTAGQTLTCGRDATTGRPSVAARDGAVTTAEPAKGGWAEVVRGPGRKHGTPAAVATR